MIFLKDITIRLDDKPGTLADITDLLAKESINLSGVCGFQCEGKGVIHLLLEETTEARSLLKLNGYQVDQEREVFVLDIEEDQPGILAEITRHLAGANVNIEMIYLATNSRIVLAVDDIVKAQNAF